MPGPRGATVHRSFAGYAQEFAYACGSRIPLLATRSLCWTPTTLGLEEKAVGTGSEVRSFPDAATSTAQTGARRAVVAPGLDPNG